MQVSPLTDPVVANFGPLSHLPLGEGRTFRFRHWVVALFRNRQGKVFATQATCPHRKGPLADGTVGGTTLVCPLHGLKFDLPTGSPLGHACGGLLIYPVRVSEKGDVLVTLSQ
jgi:nitrite reductase (NADH) small subunit